jgi:hypothetical protein
MHTSRLEERNYLEQASRVITVLMLGAAIVACIFAPFSAIAWVRTPFAGFLLDPTMVVNGSSDPDWPGRLAGITYPQRVERINGAVVTNSPSLAAALSRYAIGQSVSVSTRLPGGSSALYPLVQLTAFRAGDLLRYFWLPYAVGVAYLAIGIWMFRLRGHTRPGRAFSYFCFCIAIVCILLFDLSTTHAGAVLWTAAIAMAGGALVSLALRFPEEWHVVTRHQWLLVIPYVYSLILAGWGTLALSNALEPRAYVEAWGASYRYAALGVAVLLIMTVYRAATSKAPAVRRQARIVLLGSGLAFAPVTIWFLAPLVGVPLSFDALIFLPSLLVFPVAVAIAIFRHRLLEVEVIVNRTLFYGALTALLAGLFSALVILLQRVFVALTGERSDIAIVVTTLLLVAILDRIKVRAQKVVDRQFKETPDTTRSLRRFGDQVGSVVQLTDETHMVRRLLDEAATSLHAQSGAVSLLDNGRPRIVHSVGNWRGDTYLCVAIACNGQSYGFLHLGPRSGWAQYTRQECEALQVVAQDVARSVRLARALKSLPALSEKAAAA